MNEKLRRDDRGRKKSGGRIKKANASLLADIGDMPEIPCNEIVYFVEGSQRNMDRIGHKFSVKYAARNVPLGKDRHFFPRTHIYFETRRETTE